MTVGSTEGRLFIDPIERVACPVQHLTIFEPKADLTFSILDTVTSMTDVTANFNTKVTTDRSWSRFKRVGRTVRKKTGAEEGKSL